MSTKGTEDLQPTIPATALIELPILDPDQRRKILLFPGDIDRLNRAAQQLEITPETPALAAIAGLQDQTQGRTATRNILETLAPCAKTNDDFFETGIKDEDQQPAITDLDSLLSLITKLPETLEDEKITPTMQEQASLAARVIQEAMEIKKISQDPQPAYRAFIITEVMAVIPAILGKNTPATREFNARALKYQNHQEQTPNIHTLVIDLLQSAEPTITNLSSPDEQAKILKLRCLLNKAFRIECGVYLRWLQDISKPGVKIINAVGGDVPGFIARSGRIMAREPFLQSISASIKALTAVEPHLFKVDYLPKITLLKHILESIPPSQESLQQAA